MRVVNERSGPGNHERLQNKIKVLHLLDESEVEDAKLFKKKLEVLKDIALLVVAEIEALDHVRPVNLSEGIDLHGEVRRFEVNLIQSALERTGGHLTNAARLLRLNLPTLHNKIKRLGISTDDLVDASVYHEDKVSRCNGARGTVAV